MAGGRWRVAGDRWQVAGGRWQVAGGRWQSNGGPLLELAERGKRARGGSVDERRNNLKICKYLSGRFFFMSV